MKGEVGRECVTSLTASGSVVWVHEAHVKRHIGRRSQLAFIVTLSFPLRQAAEFLTLTIGRYLYSNFTALSWTFFRYNISLKLYTH